ncbi:MAG TPA: DUF2059 domain-containing protein [Blastocatellia bacterium]
MIGKYFQLATISIICCFALAGAAHAQEKETPTISPAKLELIKELIAVTDVANSTKLTMIQTMSSMGGFTSSLMKAAPVPSSGQNLTPEQQAQAKKVTSALMASEISRLSDSLVKGIDFDKMIAAVYVPLYDKYYTEDDLRDLIAFYKTPTGQKLVLVSPMLAAEASAKTGEFLLPMLMQNMKGLQEQMEKDIKQTTDQLGPIQKPSASPPPPRR